MIDKWIDIEHQYGKITLEFKIGKPLAPDNWDALVNAERRLYGPGDTGMLPFTDVNENTGDPQLNWMWDQARMAVDGLASFTKPEDEERWRTHQTARYVAAALGVLNFGPEFLLK